MKPFFLSVADEGLNKDRVFVNANPPQACLIFEGKARSLAQRGSAQNALHLGRLRLYLCLEVLRGTNTLAYFGSLPVSKKKVL